MTLPERRAVDVDVDALDGAESSALRRKRVDASTSIALETPPVCVFAGYEVLGRMAVGGMAEVFLARERGEGGSSRQVALKVIRAQLAASPDLAALFMQEGKVALGLNHPNICHTLRFGTEAGRPFLAMELVHGVTLRELFTRARRGGPKVSDAVIVRIVADVAEALHSAHEARSPHGRPLGIVHQDVSPQNVMVGYDGTVKLLDFGVASTSNERARETLDASQVIVRGKTAYLSPEQCSGRPADRRSDVFSLGIVLCEMLTGRRLFARRESLDTMRAIASEPLPPLPESMPASLRAVLERALANDENARYATAAAMQEDLERWLVAEGYVVTSRTIARELEYVLGSDYGRAPSIDTTSGGVAWLRSEAETLVQPIPLVTPRRSRPRRWGRAVIVLAVMAAIVITALLVPVPTAPEVTATEITPSEITAPEITRSEITAPEITAPETGAIAAPEPSSPSEHHRHRRRAPGSVIRELDF